MRQIEECRQRAAECEHEAKRAITPLDKQQWLFLADQWRKLADEMEEAGE
jgi:hypothetical protein